MKLFAPHLTDGYKLGHPSQYAAGTDFVTANFTPRDFSYAPTTPYTSTNKMVWIGMQYVIKDIMKDLWEDSFFNKPKEKVINRYARRIKHYLGSNQGVAAKKLVSDLHDLGFLPISIRALPEGSRVNAGIPVFTITNTIAGFGALVNYLETVLSDTLWPMCNSASLMEQYHLLAKHYGELTGASSEYWLPFAIHNFAMRGHRGVEDSIISAFGHTMFHKGTDTFAVVDFVEDYYNANAENELIGVSVNASEHATVCQQIAVNGGGHDGEVKALKYFLTQVAPTGIFSYVSDSRDYWDVIGNIALELKSIILARQPNEDGQPPVLTFRPDSSPKTPFEIIMGDKDADPNSFEYKGTLQVLWDIFGGETVTGSDGRSYRLLDSHVRVIYGEAIPLNMAFKIYDAMHKEGWCVGNLFFGVGSWSFIGNSSRDTYGLATKATNSVVNGVDYPLQKDPKGTSSFKKSARGRLKVIKDGDNFKLLDNVSVEDEASGELKEVFRNSKLLIETSYSEIWSRLHG